MGQEPFRHLLIVEDDEGRHVYSIESTAYSLGRDPTSAIVLHSAAVSRQHALLLRTPQPSAKGYRYRVVDGNAQGKRSANGITVNGRPCFSWDLNDGDLIGFGGSVQARYVCTNVIPPELAAAMLAPAARSIKSIAVDSTDTFVPTQMLASRPTDRPPSVVEGLFQRFTGERAIVHTPSGEILEVNVRNKAYVQTLVKGQPVAAVFEGHEFYLAAEPESFPEDDDITLFDVPPDLGTLVERFRQCYLAVTRDLADLPLGPDGYREVAIAIFQSLPKS
ncbi:MAG: FHA domain-containing protein [Oscillatoriales cyanobacterium SM2_1_8]|nr:FHA domain-containing protein [Oscillatoriales cyanobacterium SM2_1_8]